tara:strand:- start:1269 stop:1397 length:129 start_codon:yes stop_codon:yes gene_type:complete
VASRISWDCSIDHLRSLDGIREETKEDILVNNVEPIDNKDTE